MNRSSAVRFAVIIPTYNHGSRITDVVREARTLGWPIFVVDDGSTDTTARMLDDLDGIHLLCHPANQGKGAALITGMRAAADMADYAITMDADGQHDPADARRLMAAIGDHRRAIVVGRRQMDDAPWTSRKGRAFSNFWVWAAGGGRLMEFPERFSYLSDFRNPGPEGRSPALPV